MTVDRILQILSARWRLVLTAFIGFVLLSAALAILIPKRYTTVSQVIVDVHSPDPVLGTTVPVVPQGYIATQVDVIRSERVARRVVAELDPELLQLDRGKWLRATGGEGDFPSWLAEAILKDIEVRPSRDSGVITIIYADRSARRAAAIANGFATSYIDTSRELRRTPAQESAAFFEERIRTARGNLDRAQAALSAYQRENNVLSGDSPLNVENQRLSELVSQLSAVQGIVGESRSREAAATSRGMSVTPEVLASPLITALKGDVARSEARHRDLASRLGPLHPELVAAENELFALRDRLDAESRQVARGISTLSAVNAQRESQVREAVEAQRARVLKLREDYDRLAALQRDVDVARQQFDMVSQRHTMTTLESQNRQTNVSLLTPALPAAARVFPKDLPFLLTGSVVGAILSALLALMVEWRRPRVRTGSLLQQALELPVFGELPSARSRRGISVIPMTRPATLRLPGTDSIELAGQTR